MEEGREGLIEEIVIENLVEDFLEDTLYKEIFLPGNESNEGIKTDVERVEEYVRDFTNYIMGRDNKFFNIDKRLQTS